MNDLTIYYQFRDQFKPCDPFSFKGKGLIERAIQIFSPGSNHIESIARLDQWAGKDKRVWTLGAEAGGVKLRLLSDVVANYDGEITWYPVKADYDSYRDTAFAKGLKVVGKPYDFMSLIKNPFEDVPVEFQKFICSWFWYYEWMVNADTEYPDGVLPIVNREPKPSEIITDPWGIFNPPVRIV